MISSTVPPHQKQIKYNQCMTIFIIDVNSIASLCKSPCGTSIAQFMRAITACLSPKLFCQLLNILSIN